jgi:hypothetical protein
LKFIKHENFPDGIANLIRHFEFQRQGESILEFPQALYGDDIKPGEWLECIGNQAKAHRPFILTLDSGIKGNALTLEEMRSTGCSFVVFLKAWSKEPFDSFAWRAIKIWPEVVQRAANAHAAARQCRIDVPRKGAVGFFNFPS